jgi:hypothetical protein
MASVHPRPTPSPMVLPLRAAFPSALTIPTARAVLVVWEGEDVGGTHRVLTVYDDGSILLPWASEFGGPGVRRLSASGLARLMERVTATGAFDSSRSLPPSPGWDSGFSGYDFDYFAGSKPVRVSTTNASKVPMARSLMALGDAMRDLPSVLVSPDDWWNGDHDMHPFQPEAAIVTVQSVGIGNATVDLPDESASVLAGLLPGPVDSLGTEVYGPDGSRSARCAIVDGRAALALQEEAARQFTVMETGLLLDAIPPADHPTLGGVDLRSEDGARLVRMSWRPARPGETLACDGNALPVAPDPARYVAGGADMVLGSTGGIGGAGQKVHLTVQITPEAAWWANRVTVTYLDDGTVVTSPPPSPLAGFGIRRQTQLGMRLLDDMLAKAGLPKGDRHTESTTDGPTHMYSLVFPDQRIVEASDGEQDPVARRIIDIVTRLSRPDTTFPVSAWQDPRPLPYRPDEVAVRTLFSDSTERPRADISMVRPPFDPAAFGKPSASAPEIRCKVLAIDEALALARSLRAVTAANGDNFTFATGEPGQVVEIAFELRGPMDTPPRCD